MSDKATTYATCSGCRWYLRVVRTLGTRRYCTVCAPHAHMLPISSEGIASVTR